ncbi:Omega-amidase YafV [Neolewinella maritima]|uniref:Omega-amidase YafV n=1 Tax=Neolewinella maritima TaxID=1383882 RepID=A0ABM9B502_9BACT|nr:amidohydrolase [Neolewinella maritima]CAH1002359.1 Omega-amidase YafV [Neolewinella maritima]
MLTLTLLQSDPIWQDPATNRSQLTERLTPLAGRTDLIILPEMFTTGFSMDAARLAEPHDGATVDWMCTQADRLEAALCGSIIVADGGRYYNRLYWVAPGGRTLHYDKRYLFTPGGEHEHYSAGSERLVVDYRGWKICPLVCYDLRFPEWSRNDPADPFDLLIYVASWPSARASDWCTLLAARAIENQCYVAAVNRVGEDGNGLRYRGDSRVIDPGPRGVLAALSEVDTTLTLTIARQEVLDLRRRLPFLVDRRPV